MKKSVVIDASAIVTFLLSEVWKSGKKFSRLLQDADKGKLELISSKLLPLEVANSLRFSLRDGKLADEAFVKLLALPIKYVELSRPQYRKSLEIAYQINASVYDSSYHVLAIAMGCDYLTCDKKYANSAAGLGNINFLE